MNTHPLLYWTMLFLLCMSVSFGAWEDKLIGFYPMNSTTVSGSAVNSVNVTLYNGLHKNLTTTTNALIITEGTNQSLRLNETGTQYVNLSNRLSPTTANHTVAMLIRNIGGDTQYRMFGSGVGGSDGFTMDYGITAGNFECVHNGFGGTPKLAMAVDSNWHSVICMVNSTGRYIFVDGVSGSVGTSVTPAMTNAGRAAIGAHATGATTTAFYFTGDVANVGVWNRSLTGTEIAQLSNVSLRFNPFAITASETTQPNISIIAKNPSDFNTTNLLAGAWIAYNYTNGSSVLFNLSQIYLKTAINTTNGLYQSFVNGSQVAGFVNQPYTTINGVIANISIDDNDVLYGTYNYDETLMENTTHVSYTLDTVAPPPQQRMMAIRIDNISPNIASFITLETMINNSGFTTNFTSINYCNSSYSFTVDPSATSACQPLTSVDTSSYNHAHAGGNSKHHVVPLPVNITNGFIGQTKITPRSYIIIEGRSSGDDVIVWGINASVDTNLVRVSTSSGSSWSSVSNFVPDMHIHMYNESFSFVYQACGLLTNSTTLCNGVYSDQLQIGDAYPTPPIFITPNTGTITQSILNVSWFASSVSSPSTITNYSNLRLKNHNGTVDTLLLVNTTNTFADVVLGSYPSGEYFLTLESWTSGGKSATGLSNHFIIDQSPPSCLNATNISFVTSTNALISCGDAVSSIVSQSLTCSNGISQTLPYDLTINETFNCTIIASDAFATTTYYTFYNEIATDAPQCSIIGDFEQILSIDETFAFFYPLVVCSANVSTPLQSVDFSCDNGFSNTTPLNDATFNQTFNVSVSTIAGEESIVTCSVIAATQFDTTTEYTALIVRPRGYFESGSCPLSTQQDRYFLYAIGGFALGVFLLGMLTAPKWKKDFVSAFTMRTITSIAGFVLCFVLFQMTNCFTLGSVYGGLFFGLIFTIFVASMIRWIN